jgi:hypothetical protein
LAQRPYGFYKYENEVNETVFVRPGHVYTFTALDMYGDGITDGGYFQILAGSVDGNVPNEYLIVSPTQVNGRDEQRTFLAPYPASSDDETDNMDRGTMQSNNVSLYMPSATPSAKASLEPSVEPSEARINDQTNDSGRLCIATGHFCQDNDSCCSLTCRSGFCLKNPRSRDDKKIHQGHRARIGT